MLSRVLLLLLLPAAPLLAQAGQPISVIVGDTSVLDRYEIRGNLPGRGAAPARRATIHASGRATLRLEAGDSITVRSDVPANPVHVRVVVGDSTLTASGQLVTVRNRAGVPSIETRDTSPEDTRRRAP